MKNARWHAVFSAYLSITTGIAGFVLTVVAANAEMSMALYGIALIEIVDVSASFLVLLVYQAKCGIVKYRGLNAEERRKETKYSFLIGVLMAILGSFLLIDRYLIHFLLLMTSDRVNICNFLLHCSVLKLWDRDHERLSLANERLAFAASLFGAIFSISLAVYQFYIAEALDSSVVFFGMSCITLSIFI